MSVEERGLSGSENQSLLPRRLPAAVLHFSGPDLPSRSWDALGPELARRIPPAEPAGSWLLALTPQPRHPDLFDAGLALARYLLAGPQDSRLPALDQLRVLLLPAFVTGPEKKRRPTDEPLCEALERGPELPFPPGVYVTSRVAQLLEGSWQLSEAGSWTVPRGPVVPLQRVEGWREQRFVPIRNAQLFGSPTRWLPRKELEAALQDQVKEPLLRIEGPFGSGKSRLGWEVLKRQQGLVAWASPVASGLAMLEILLRRSLAITEYPKSETVLQRLEVAREKGKDVESSAAKLLLQVLKKRGKAAPPLYLVCDGLESASATDLTVLAALAGSVRKQPDVHLVLIGRPGVDLGPLARLKAVQVPLFDESSLILLGRELAQNIEMPAPVLERFVAASSGSPLCLEEGMVELIHRRLLRRIYGSFFFNGPSDTDYQPSLRLVLSFLHETERLGATGPLLALAVADGPLPGAAAAATAAAVGRAAHEGWVEPYLDAGWVRPADTPWGPGVEVAFTAAREALAASLTDEARQLLRTEMGRWLREQGSEAGAWHTYRLLEGSEDAAAVLLDTLKPLPAEVNREEAFAALRREIEALRRRSSTEEEELRLLWALLPLARRLGRLHDIRPELDRALALCEESPDKALAVLILLADLEAELGQSREAESFIRRALELAIEHDHRRKGLIALQLGRFLRREERLSEARNVLERLLQQLTSHKAAAVAAACRFQLGNIALQQQRYEDALSLHREALAAREQLQLGPVVGASLCALGATCLRMGDYRQAMDYYQQANETLGSDVKDGELAFALYGLGAVYHRLGQHLVAIRYLRQALEMREGRDSRVGTILCLLALADCHLDLEQTAEALASARKAHFRLTMMDDNSLLGDAERLLGKVLLRQNQGDKARGHFRSALESHKKLQRSTEVAEDLGWLLAEALEREDRSDVELLVRQLEEVLANDYPERGELLDHRLYESLEWLQHLGSKVPWPPLRFLRRAYRELLRKTSYLDPEQRSAYLMNIPEHQAIVEAATRNQLSLPKGM